LLNIFRYIKQIIGLFTKQERRRLNILYAGAVIVTAIQLVGVGTIGPFISVASDPDMIFRNEILNMVYNSFGFGNSTSFIVTLGVGVIIILILTNVAMFLYTYAINRFSNMRRHTLSTRLMTGYLSQQYSYFLKKNSFEFIKNINSEVNVVITGMLMQYIELISKFIQAFLIIIFLLLVNPISTFILLGSLMTVYLAIYLVIRNPVKSLGVKRFELNTLRAQVVSEAFWGIKETKILGVERVFLDEYQTPSIGLAQNASSQVLFSQFPKYALETIAFSSIMLVVLISVLGDGDFASVAPMITVYAYAGYRLIPAIQGVFTAVTKLKYGEGTTKKILDEFNSVRDGKEIDHAIAKRMDFRESIKVSGISFRYSKELPLVLQNINFTIPKHSMIGIAGKTGSGKTTLIDILLGLHVPQLGGIYVDDLKVTNDNLRGWQQNLGYIPQSIYLINDSVSSNVAFGVPRAEIDLEKVRYACHMAQIDIFIEEELPEKYETKVGERGVRLSGGQKQRLGIARALYRNPDILIMDEATSALDGHTEEAVMRAIDSLMGVKTIIMIAHRISTLRNCDAIYLIENGEITDEGTYNELIERNPYFSK
jgi:ABC-type bacteriocin/lantibiotic exporter with double-glycine peptidase domain